jgi:acyl-CoA thioesterase FadM
MARVKLKFPSEKSLFTATISVRIGDINYGNHVGNDAILSIIHEARMQMLGSVGFTELDVAGDALIMADVMIAFKAESFYGDILKVDIYADEITTFTFDLLYRLSTIRNGMETDIAHAKTGMVCFDYKERRVVGMNTPLKNFLLNLN